MPMPDSTWFFIQSGPDAGRWHMAGWDYTAIKTEDLSIAGGARDRTRGWLSLPLTDLRETREDRAHREVDAALDDAHRDRP